MGGRFDYGWMNHNTVTHRQDNWGQEFFYFVAAHDQSHTQTKSFLLYYIFFLSLRLVKNSFWPLRSLIFKSALQQLCFGHSISPGGCRGWIVGHGFLFLPYRKRVPRIYRSNLGRRMLHALYKYVLPKRKAATPFPRSTGGEEKVGKFVKA